MPLDFRRFNGPEDTISYKRFTKDNFKSYDELLKELLEDNGLRKDGRALDESRSLCMFFARTDINSQAKGSSYMELKKTKVVCSVFDPREIVHQNEYSTLGQLFCEVKFAPFSCSQQRRSHAPDSEERALSVSLRKALEPAVCRHLFPNTQIDIFVYILENDGACLAAAINAAGLALADAAVPMFDVITACSLAIIQDQIFVDPTDFEERLALMSPEGNEKNNGMITIAMLLELGQVANFCQIGSMDVDCVMNSMEILQQECKKLQPNIQQILVSNVVKTVEHQKKLDEETIEREIVLNAKMDEWKALFKAGGD